MAIGSFFELAHSSSSYASFVQSAMQQISGQGTAPHFDEWDENMNLITDYDQKINYLEGLQQVVIRNRTFNPSDIQSIIIAERTQALAESLDHIARA